MKICGLVANAAEIFAVTAGKLLFRAIRALLGSGKGKGVLCLVQNAASNVSFYKVAGCARATFPASVRAAAVSIFGSIYRLMRGGLFGWENRREYSVFP